MNEQSDYLSLLDAAMHQLRDSPSELDQELYSYFTTLRHQAEGAQFAFRPPPPVAVLNRVVVDIERKARQDSNVMQKGSASVASFFLIFTSELRKIICGNRKTPGKLGREMHAVLAALGAFIAAKLGVSDPTATGIAVLLLITITQATKNAFVG
jgi:hypothetical protein